MKGYKAFNKGLICKDKQYKENEVFEEEKAVPCHRCMHFCKNPFDVLNYYDLVDNNGDFSDFAEVEAPDDAEVKTDDNIKQSLRLEQSFLSQDLLKLALIL